MKKRRKIMGLLAAIILMGSCAGAEGKVIVSLGDSYSSGEGVEPFYGQDAEMAVKCQNPDWLAHRSEKAWPGLLTLSGVKGPMKDHRGENWFFVAASGAVTSNLFLLTETEKAEGMSAEQEKSYDRDGVSGTAMLAPQLDIFDELDRLGLKADYVTVSLGGNDIGFNLDVGLAFTGFYSRMPVTEEEKYDLMWRNLYRFRDVRSKIKRAYTDIAARAGDQAWIIVAGYPELINPEGGTNGFPAADAKLMNATASQFNAEIRDIVKECRGEGIKICFVSVEEEFAGHGAYTEDPYINPLVLASEPQDLKSASVASIYSMHPNENGNLAYARCVQAMIDRLENGEIPEDD